MSSSVGIMTYPKLFLESHKIPWFQSPPTSMGSYVFFMIFLWFSYGFLWFSYGFPMIFLWFSYGFPMVSYGKKSSGLYPHSLFHQLPASRLPHLKWMALPMPLAPKLTPLKVIRLSWQPWRIYMSLDWFKGKSTPETHGFLPSNIGLSCFNFPIIQFYEYDHIDPLNWMAKLDGFSGCVRNSPIFCLGSLGPPGQGTKITPRFTSFINCPSNHHPISRVPIAYWGSIRLLRELAGFIGPKKTCSHYIPLYHIAIV